LADHKETFPLVVNGENTTVEINVNEPLRNLVKAGLKETDNEKGHALEDWEVRAVTGGPVLDQSKKIEDYHFAAGTKLYVDLKVGGGG